MSKAVKQWQEFQARIMHDRAVARGTRYSSVSADREVFLKHAEHEERRVKAEAKRAANRRAFIRSARHAAKKA